MQNEGEVIFTSEIEIEEEIKEIEKKLKFANKVLQRRRRQQLLPLPFSLVFFGFVATKKTMTIRPSPSFFGFVVAKKVTVSLLTSPSFILVLL